MSRLQRSIGIDFDNFVGTLKQLINSGTRIVNSLYFGSNVPLPQLAELARSVRKDQAQISDFVQNSIDQSNLPPTFKVRNICERSQEAFNQRIVSFLTHLTATLKQFTIEGLTGVVHISNPNKVNVYQEQFNLIINDWTVVIQITKVLLIALQELSVTQKNEGVKIENVVFHIRETSSLMKSLSQLVFAHINQSQQQVYYETNVEYELTSVISSLLISMQKLVDISSLMGCEMEEDELKEEMNALIPIANLVFRTRSQYSQDAMKGQLTSIAVTLKNLLINIKIKLNPESQNIPEQNEVSQTQTRGIPPPVRTRSPSFTNQPQQNQPSVGRRSTLSSPQVPKRPISEAVPQRRLQKMAQMKPTGYFMKTQNINAIIRFQRFVRRLLIRRRWYSVISQWKASPKSMNLRHRTKALLEIQTTEKYYLDSLKLCISVFITPLRTEKKYLSLVREEDQNIIFSNLEQIVALNTDLYSRLQNSFKQWPSVHNFAEPFIKLAPFMKKRYSEYIINFDKALALLEQLQKKPNFQSFLKEGQERTKAALDLGAYLIQPVQRLCRYELLLKGLVKMTDSDHVHLPALKEALSVMQEVNDKVNAMKKLEYNKAKMTEISEKIVNRPPSLENLNIENRVFIREGQMDVIQSKDKKKTALFCYLFNDLLIFVKGPKKTKEEFVDVFFFHSASVQKNTSPGSENEFSFSLIKDRNQLPVQLFFEEEALRDVWLKEVDSSITSHHIETRSQNLINLN